MSARNGDKARFGRLRKRKILLRKRVQDLKNAIEAKAARIANAASKAAP